MTTENTTVNDRVNLEAEHTPCVGPNKIMSVVHTPLLRPSCVTPLIRSGQAGHETGLGKSRAGFKHQEQDILHRTDMRKLRNVQKSLNLSLPPQVNLNKSPTIIGGRVEMFGNITEMIAHWEGEDMKLKEEGEGGKRRKSKVEEMSLLFEGGNASSLPNSLVGGRGAEGSNILKKCNVGPNINTNKLNGQGVRTPSACTALNNARSKLYFSPANQNSRGSETANQRRAEQKQLRDGGISVVGVNPIWRKCSSGQH